MTRRTWLAAILLLVLIGVACDSGDGNDDASGGDVSDDDTSEDDADDDDADDDDFGDDDDTGDDDDDTGPYPPEYCAYFLTGEVDLVGIDADNDGSPNGWDHCPNNPEDWLDSDRDGIGNRSDPDMDGDGILNADDPDRDGDGVDDLDEEDAGTDPDDPSSIPELRRFDLDLGIFDPNPGWYLGDLHVHSEYSHDSYTPIWRYPPATQKVGLDFLWITDHRVFEAPFDPYWDQDQVLLIPGMEWGGPGHANIGGIRTDNTAVYEDPDDVRRAWRVAKLQGGVQSLNHYGSDTDYWDGMFDLAPDLLDFLDVIEVWNVFWLFNTEANEPSVALWEQLMSEGYRIAAVGGSDSHLVPGFWIGPATVVWAETLSVPGILDGIRRGRTYITQGDLITRANRPELDFRVDADGDGVFEAMLGDEVLPGSISLQIGIRNAKGPVVLLRDGAEIARFANHAPNSEVTYEIEDDAPPGAWYRIEMREDALPSSPMRLLSSAIYVRQE